MTDTFERGIFRIRFPYVEGEGGKKRPALALSEPDNYGDIAWAFITTQPYDPASCIEITPDDLAEGHLPRKGFLHVDKIFTIHQSQIDRPYGRVTPSFWQSLLKRGILSQTRKYSLSAHVAHRPGDDPLRLNHEGASPANAHNVPYAGRVFTEDEVEAAVSSTLDFWLTLGREGEAFESELADFLGVRRSILTNSGSSANLLALTALTSHKLPPEKRIRPGDEVITCAAGFPTTVAPILQNGAVPVFLDNDPLTGNADLSRLEEAYVPGKTKAVMMAHALGNPFDLASILTFCRKYDLWLIEDNCDALGCTYSLPLERARALDLDHLIQRAERNASSAPSALRYPRIHNGMLTAFTGSFGDLSTQSFYPPHHLTLGEGGAVNIVRDMKLKVLVESFRDWGRDCWCPSGKDNTCNKRFGWKLGELPEGYDHKYIYSHLGYNLKPLDPQAAIGRAQLRKLPAFIQARKDNWQRLREGLADLEDVFAFALPTHATGWQATRKGDDAFSWDTTGCRTSCSWFGFLMLLRPEAPFTRTQFVQYLDEKKIGNRMLFGGNLVRQPAFVQLRKDTPYAFRIVGRTGQTAAGSDSEDLPGADRIMNQAVFIGVYPGLTSSLLDYMITSIRAFVNNTRASDGTRTASHHGM